MLLAFKCTGEAQKFLQKFPSLNGLIMFHAIRDQQELISRQCVPPQPPPRPGSVIADRFAFFSIPKSEFSALECSTEIVKLLSFFPPTDLASLEETWNDSPSWGTCFDEIHHLVHSHGCIAVRYNSFPLTHSAMNIWLPEFPLQRSDGSYDGDASTQGGRWSIIVQSPPDVVPQAADPQIAASMDDWEIVDRNFSEMAVEEDVSVESLDSSDQSTGTDSNEEKQSADSPPSRNQTAIGRRSYRDMLVQGGLHPRREEAVANTSMQLTTKAPWKPTLITTKVTRLRADRQYVSQVSDNYDEEDGYWDLIDSQLRNKMTTGVARVRSITMLTPAAQEKKDQRILEKAQSQAVNAGQAK